MAVSQIPLNYRFYPSSSHSLLQPENQFPANGFRSLEFRARSSHRTAELEHQQPKPTRLAIQSRKQKRKPRPSFFDQVRDKWSVKITSRKQKLPWQEEDGEGEERADEVRDELAEEHSLVVAESDPEANSTSHGGASDQVSYRLSSSAVLAPWSHGRKHHKPLSNFVPEISQSNPNSGVTLQSVVAQKSKKLDVEVIGNSTPVESPTDEKAGNAGNRNGIVKSSEDSEGYVDGDTNATDVDGRKWQRSNTEAVERMVPEHELRRLRNIALRMVERTKVGVVGITQELVDQIHEKWKLDEVVKLKFELPLSLNMKRTHELLEKRTGGLVIWRSGSSLVLFRGMSYKFECVQSYARQKQEGVSSNSAAAEAMTASRVSDSLELKVPSTRAVGSFTPVSSELLKDHPENLIDLCELDHLLDELGPRYKDWYGRKPLPVDADQLPPTIPGYKTPFRVLPYGVRRCLRDKEMTEMRKFARDAPAHFVLGRNRELQGLAKAMVKLWEKNAIAKIAIKRGVLNTRNERMAEELKKLTGGTLLSRNKEYIVFYRGNDFLLPMMMDMLKERQNLRNFKQDEEEAARQRGLALMDRNAKASKCMAVAGTLAETKAAASHWGHQPSSEDIKKMMRDDALTRQASSVRYLEKKIAFAKGKLKKAEKALAKVQEFLEPSELPTDLETLSDEERFLFRKIGLSMKPYLLLGRRGVYDGTIENMHLHWKHRELIKIIVKGKNFAQVKHIAISLEAESGGVLISLDKTTKGYALIIYRGKNYMRPYAMRPKNLLTRRQALARSIELQRREALKHHISDLQGKIVLLKSEMEEMKAGKEINVDKTSHLFSEADFSDEDSEEDEGEEAYLETYDHGSDSDDDKEPKQFVR